MVLRVNPTTLDTTGAEAIYASTLDQTAAVHGLVITNVTDSDATFGVSMYDRSANTTIELASGVNVFARSVYAWPRPINMEQGDELYLTASANSTLTAVASVYEDETISQGFTLRGEWSSIENYAVNDVVEYEGTSYGAIIDGTGKQPDVETTYWMILSRRGTHSPRSYIINGPVGGEKVPLFYNANSQYSITEIRSLVSGDAPTVVFSVRYGTNFSQTGTEVVTGGISTANSTLGLSTTTFNNGTIPANNYVWATVSSVSANTDFLHITIT